MSDLAATQGHAPVEPGSLPGVDNRKFGMWLFIVNEIMLFAAFIGLFIAYNNTDGMKALKEVIHANPLTGIIGTSVLLFSSLMVVLSIASIQRNSRRGLMLFLFLTALLGLTFLGIQYTEFTALNQEGFVLETSSATSAFYVMTSFHGLHVFIGVVWALSVLFAAWRNWFSSQKYAGVELFGLYWHFVDVVWIILFLLIYLL
ncbi:MAG TPA: heme-copper oxidase subunit III [Anaerolineae bacterium]|nr:heme-copper oxidase subunit III [Anaerolineae bacterium]